MSDRPLTSDSIGDQRVVIRRLIAEEAVKSQPGGQAGVTYIYAGDLGGKIAKFVNDCSGVKLAPVDVYGMLIL